MRLQHEIDVFSAVIKDKSYGISGIFLVEASVEILSQNLLENKSFENLNFQKLSTCGSYFTGVYDLQQETYDDWVSINNQTYSLAPWVKNHQLTLISEEEYNQYCLSGEYNSSGFYRLTRPGFSKNFSQALIQIYGYCPIAFSFGSVIYLERVSEKWCTLSSYGLYNQ
ncbi:hypothetical protein CAL7716_104010 (plasmid) [Calothrix sp. PCC 7716]|nr:hypothetical protein CAL7716_104010 [Calothrix sp. PCC 7716]